MIRKILFILAVILLTGCQTEELEQAEQSIIVLQDALETVELSNVDLITEVESTLSDYSDLEILYYEKVIEYERTNNMLNDINESIAYLPYYIKQLIGETGYGLVSVPLPPDTYLLLDKERAIGGYKVYEAEWGICEGAMIHEVYSDDEVDYIFISNAGCNPERIGAPLYLHLNGSLLTIQLSVDLGYITIDDLEEAQFIFKNVY